MSGGSSLAQLAALTGYDLSIHELLDALWLAGRLPRDGSAPLAGALHATPVPYGSPPSERPPPAPRGGPPGSGQPPGPAPPPRHSPAQLIGALHAAASTARAPDFTGPATPRGPSPPAGALPVRVPEDKALGAEELRIGRALRPLKQRQPGRHDREFDESATAAAMAETGLPDVVTRPARERWLDLVLVIDDGISMLLWRRLATELRFMLERLGAFRALRVHGLDSRSPDGPRLRVRPFDPDAPLLSPASAADPSGRSLVLVISDGVGACWRGKDMHAALERWARLGPTAVIHALPAHMWDGSGIRAQKWRVTTRRRGSANDSWEVSDPLLPPELAEDFEGVAVPVLEPYPAHIAAWAQLVASPGASAELPLLAPVSEPGRRPSAAVRGSAAPDAVLRFKDAASPQAYRLAAHLAAVSPITVPVMRLVLAAVPSAQTGHLAEVFLGGLMRRSPQDGDRLPPQQHSFEFVEGAQEILLDTASPVELLRTTRAVTEHLSALVGRSPDFPAWLAHPAGTGELMPGTRPFAWLEDRLLTHLGAQPMAPPRARPVEDFQEVRLPEGLERSPSWLPLRPLDPRRLGPYELRMRGEAEVRPVAYIGADADGRQVLLRVPHTFASPMARELLGVELRALRRMDGVYAPAVLDSAVNHPDPWIALELDTLSTGLPAPPLRAVLDAAGPLHDSPLLTWLGWHLARAVGRCHAKGIVHGALTPGTVLVTEDTLRIVNWTSARIDGTSSASPLAMPTASPYRAPEVTSWAESRIAAGDVYALGTILVEAATGRNWRWFQREPLFLQHEFQQLSDDLRDVLTRCVEQEPEARPTAAEVAEVFAAYLPDAWVHEEERATPPKGEPVGAGPDQDAERDRLLGQIRAPVPSSLHLTVLGVKDRVGCTTTTTVLGALLAEQRQEPVLAIDADQHPGGHIRITRRVYRSTEARLADLAHAAGEVHTYEAFRLFVSEHRSGLTVLANDSVSRPAVPGQFSDQEYARVSALADWFHRVILTDTDRFPQAVLERADRVVIVSRADPAGLTQAQQAMDRLLTLGMPHLVAGAVVVLNNSRPAAGWTLDPATVRDLGTRCRGVIMIPRDSHLATSSVIELSWLAPETYKAYLRLAALLLT